MKRILKLSRFFSEENPFKDSEGRFRMRWDVKENPNLPIQHPNEIPTYVPNLAEKPDKKRIFDFDLPKEFRTFEPPLQIWSIADGMFSVNQIWIPGPILIYPEAVFQWHASRLEDIEDQHMDIIKLIQPRVEYCVIGTGKSKKIDFADALRQRFRMLGINVDFCPTVLHK